MAVFNKRTTQNQYKSSIYIGFVKQVIDKKRAGRLKVWIPELGSDENDPSGWLITNYCSPFAGTTYVKGVDRKDPTQFEGTQLSYGFIAVPPDIDNEVVVLIPDGDTAKAMWIGCLYKEYMNHMIPDVAASNKSHQTPNLVPVAEYNKFDKKVQTPVNPYKRPFHKTRTEGLGKQGLIKDKVRGITNSSINRDDTPSVIGILTPGPADPNIKKIKDVVNNEVVTSRLGGHSFVMDDGVDHEHITLRTRSGAQIKLDETNGIVYIINKLGTAWVQLDAEGNVDIFSAKSMSIRAQESINMRADKDINIEAGQNVNIKAAKDTDQAGKIVGEDGQNSVGGNVVIQALNEMHTTVKNNTYLTVTNGNMDVAIQTGNKTETINGTKGTKSSNYHLTPEGDIDNAGIINSGGIHYAPDFKAPSVGLVSHIHTHDVWINAQNHSDAMKPPVQGGGSGSATGPDALPAVVKPLNKKTNVLATFPKGTKDIKEDYWKRDTQEVDTTVDRLLTFEPCPEHTNKGE